VFSGANWPLIVIPIIGGCPSLLLGVSEVYTTAQMARSFVSTSGTVMDGVFRPLGQGGAAYAPVVEFQTRERRVVRFMDGIGTYPPE
jgi:hypothetical protein